jgi:cytochrome o ubiquinol oxidase subunit II
MNETGASQNFWLSGTLDPHGPIGAAERTILLNATTIMLAVVVPVIVATLAFAYWFRAGNRKAVYLPDWSYSGSIEVVVWSIPTLIVLFLGGIAWIGSHDLDPPRAIAGDAAPIHVEVVSMDWKWLFIYPDLNVASVNRLVAPVGAPISLRLTSASVMNSFFVPQLGSQIYTMSGMTTRLNLEADRSGIFPGISAQFSGSGFSDMRFEMAAVAKEDFDKWIAAAHAGGGALDAQSYSALAKPSAAVAPMTFGAVAPDLFENVLKAAMPAAAMNDGK